LGERDKIEPFWARHSRAKRSGPPPLIVPERNAETPRTSEPAAPPAEEPREPSFTVSHEARRAAIADLMADAGGRDAAPAEPMPAAAAPGLRQEPSLGPAPPEAAAAPDAQGWISLTRAQAAQHPLYGVGGWLVVLALFLALGLAMGVVEVFDFWATTDHGGLSAWIMAGLRSLMTLWAALIFILLLTASRAFPTAFVAYTIFYIIYLGLFGLAFAHVTHGAVFIGVAAAIPLHLFAIAYVLRSRRVNVTFRRRVRAKKHAETLPPPGEGVEASPA
jgi:hypothetical protein